MNMVTVGLKESAASSRKHFLMLVGYVGVPAFTVIAFALISGWAYWIWLAIKLDSFGMFLFGLLGPLGIVAALFGLWSLFFGLPAWIAALAVSAYLTRWE
jgi:hypothetical protein